jgi:type IV secretion system protein VirB10
MKESKDIKETKEVKTTKNPVTVDLSTPKPKVTKISRLAGIIIILILAGIFGVAIFSLSDNNHHKTQNNTAEQSDAQATADDKSWYQNKPDAVISKPKATAISSDVLDNVSQNVTQESKEQIQFEKMKQDAYLQAISSSLSPSGIGSQIAPSNVSHANNDSSLDPNLRKLPLSDEQIQKLSNAFGGEGSIGQNLQAEKQSFLEKMARKTDKDYLDESLKNPVSPFEVQAGSIIPAELGAGINSDLPGQLTAIVRQNVYDSVTGRYLLIPQGSKLIIIYDSNIAYGQERILPSVKRIIFPNGQSMDLEGMPASDISGYAGFHDQVDNHYGRIYGAAIIMGGIAAAFQVSQPPQNQNAINPNTSQIAAGAMGQQLAQVTTATVSKNLNIQPTLTIRPGYQFNVNVTADMIFPKPYVG